MSINRESGERGERENPKEELYLTLREILKWENATMDSHKVRDTEMYMVSGMDHEFVALHHRVEPLLEAWARYGGNRIKMPNDMDPVAYIFRQIKNREPIEVVMLGSDRKPIEKNIDLRQIARLIKMKEFNRFMGAGRWAEDELENHFFSGGDIVVRDKQIGRVKEIDFWESCPLDDLENFDFDKYIKKIEDNQNGLQWMGNLKDEAMAKTHSENAGHSRYGKTHRKSLNGYVENRWLPSCTTQAVADSRGDVLKVSASKRTNGHPHEEGDFNEDTGVVVRYDTDLLRIHRKGVDYRSFDNTNQRMANSAIALQQYEQPDVEKSTEASEKVNFLGKDGKRKSLSVIHIGGRNRDGLVYKALHKTYDEGIQTRLGRGLTDEEADDLIITDIMAPFMAHNAQDFLMCMSKAISGNISSYSVLNAITKGSGGKWAENFDFCLMLRCKNDSGQIGERAFYSYQELIDYVNKRIVKGDIVGVDRKTELKFNGIEKAELERQEAEREEFAFQELLDELHSELDRTELENFSKLFSRLFGTNANKVLQDFARSGLQTEITEGGVTRPIKELLREKLKTIDFSGAPDDFKLLVANSGITASGDEAKIEVIKYLKKLCELTPEETGKMESLVESGKADQYKTELMKVKTAMREKLLSVATSTPVQTGPRISRKKPRGGKREP